MLEPHSDPALLALHLTATRNLALEQHCYLLIQLDRYHDISLKHVQLKYKRLPRQL